MKNKTYHSVTRRQITNIYPDSPLLYTLFLALCDVIYLRRRKKPGIDMKNAKREVSIVFEMCNNAKIPMWAQNKVIQLSNVNDF